ncbi:MAG: ubiquinone/menaquinone biosynthesis C-methylase UbiE [Polaribacter sp.]|jgi:ubiquinone/menaquinone biosynthesis C-methylase UbiE
MKLNDLKKNWDQFGKEDPYWAILTDPDKKDNKWDEQDFFESGRLRTDQVAKRIRRLNPNFSFHSALDFGCGSGRLTQGLANHFEMVAGVDIAASMIQLANEKNKKDNCTYFLNEKNDLSLFKNKEFDFVFSEMTLQHMQPKYAKNYIKDFLRIIKPEGIIMFQIPSKPDRGTRIHHSFSSRIKQSFSRFLRPKSLENKALIMEMYWIPIDEMVAFLTEHGAKIIMIKKNNAAGDSWDSYSYIVGKV